MRQLSPRARRWVLSARGSENPRSRSGWEKPRGNTRLAEDFKALRFSARCVGQKHLTFLPRFRIEPRRGFCRHAHELLFEAEVLPSEILHLFVPEPGSEEELEEQEILGRAGGKEALQFLGTVGLRDAFHVARPVAPAQKAPPSVGFEHLAHHHHLGPDGPL